MTSKGNSHNAVGRDVTTLAVLADLVGGRVSGDPSTCINGAAALQSAGPGDISFLVNAKQPERLADCQASAIIVSPALDGATEKPLLLVDNPYLAFAKILGYLKVPAHVPQGVSPDAKVHPGATLADAVTISAGCVVGDGAVIGRGTCLHPNVVVYPGVTIGDDCLLHANVVVREDCRLGDRVILQPGVVIGADGFGYVPEGEKHYKIPQVGRVILESDVEVGAGSCIDRGTLGDTRVAAGTKIDNLVQVAHNVEIGENSILVSQSGVAGSAKIGRHCIVGGRAAVSDHVTVGDNVTLAGRSGVTNDVAGNQVVAGFPVMPHRDWLRAAMTFQHLPEMRRELNRLKKLCDELINKQYEDED